MLFAELNTDTMDLSIDFYGFEECAPSYSFGPAIRDNYVIHYISQGKGTFYYKNQEIPLSAGDLFLLKANETTFYQADSEDPWSYYWIGIGGNKADLYFGLSSLGEVAYIQHNKKQSTKKVAKQMIQLITQAEEKERTIGNQLELLSQAYQLLYELNILSPNSSSHELSQTEKICQECRHVIEKHYSIDGLSISSIAQKLNVNRSYLTTLFKKYYHVSPKDYLLQTRMKRAKQLLENTQESIKVISYSVGYLDPLYFSKAFKEFYSMSPSQFRKNDRGI
ncbi:AraC-like DNA-binding protein [Streptococcus rupicaprae]|uniref:AraC-like DNA-binding protein n=1 Tax=Streptococcus rupicaprae TaxID=759619 RepID=A0ABV2FGJ4_9STRE